MKEDFPKITISGTSEPIKAYSLDLSGGGQEQFKLRISFVSNSSVNYEPDSTNLITVTIGNFYTFKGYIVSVSNRESVASGRTTELSLVDNSIILDKLWVGLKGKYGPPQAYSRQAQSKQNTINLNELSKVVNFTSVNSNGTDDLNSLYIFETHGKFPSNLILVGEAIDPCTKLQSEAYFDPCDPCSSQQKFLSLDDCQKNRDFQILDVDYTFSDLIAAAKSKNVIFGATFSDILNYRAQYVGTLREVLNQWCDDYGYSFYWDGEKVVFVNLASGININDGNLLNSEKCKIEDISTTKSIEGNVKNINIAYFGKNGEIKEYDCLSRKSSRANNSITITLQQMSLERFINGNYYTQDYSSGALKAKTPEAKENLLICTMLTKAGSLYPEYLNLRDNFIWTKIYGFSTPDTVRLTSVGLVNSYPIAILAVCHPNTTQTQAGPYDPKVLRAIYYHVKNLPDIAMGVDDYIVITVGGRGLGEEARISDVEKTIGEVAGRVWMKTTNRTGAKYSYTHPDGNLRIFEGQEGDKGYIISPESLNLPQHAFNMFNSKTSDLLREQGTYIVLEREPIWRIGDPKDQKAYRFVTKDITLILNIVAKSQTLVPKDYPFAGSRELRRNALNEEIDWRTDIRAFIVKSYEPTYKNRFSIYETYSRREINRDEFKGLGLTNNKCLGLLCPLYGTEGEGKDIRLVHIETPPIGNYRVSRQEESTSLEKAPLKAIIPKLEMIIIGDNNNINDKNYIASNITYKDITDNDLSKQTQIGNRCFVDRSKVFSYGNEIIKDLYNNSPQVKESKTYTILGVPDSNFSPEDGLSSFSIRLDSSGTKTLLNFSNTLPKMKSENVIKKQLDYLLKKQFNKSYINNILQ
jgi:hypothetical protein